MGLMNDGAALALAADNYPDDERRNLVPPFEACFSDQFRRANLPPQCAKRARQQA
jgi:hypothetical protein